MIVEPSKIYICKVRTLHKSGKGLNSLATSARPQGSTSALQRRLTMAMPHPSGLPAAAILCVRTLRSPLPGSLSTHAGRASRSWEQAVAVSLQQLVGRAVRPAHGAVPVHAEAVLFADRAEMLACLAHDSCQGLIGLHWWWKSLFYGQDPSQAVVSAWLAQPTYLPAALQHLTQMGQVIPFIQSLHSTEIQRMVQHIIAYFALYELQPLYAAEQTSALTEQAQQWRLSHSPQSASWQRWAPESADAKLQLEQQWLLAIGLTLMRAPAVARSSTFAHALLYEQHGARTPPFEHTAQYEQHNAHILVLTHATLYEKSEERERIDAYPPTSVHAAFHERSEEHKPVAAPMLLASEPYADEILEAEIDTELGGLFYLINLSLFLGLYSDFTAPLQPGIALNIWDFLALLGQALTSEKRQIDPVWQLLACLAGRSIQEPPGRDFMPPESWRVPAEWLQPFTEEDPWRWIVHNGRVQVWHPARFLVLDVALEVADPFTQLATELQAYGPVEIVPGRRPPLPARGKRSARVLTRWLGWLMPYVRARLQRALGLAPADDLATVLCRHYAHISLTTTHLDLVFALDHLPIEVRLSGLDRNPGWVPAAGRSIAFSFE